MAVLVHGRFQPFTRGHFALLEFARSINPEVYVLIGEGIYPEDNPFNLNLRIKQAKKFIPWAKIGYNKLIPKNFGGDWPKWLLWNLGKFYPNAKITKVVGGPDYNVSGWEKYGVDVVKTSKRFFGDKGAQYRKSKGFSVITNFGCGKNCFFCAWKNQNHKLKTEENKINWEYLDWCISKYKGYKISISGGGDPLFNIKKNLYALKKIAQTAEKHKKLVDLHTNENLLDKIETVKRLGFYQVVVSSHILSEVRKKELSELMKFCQVRVVMIYANQSMDYVEKWIKFYSFAQRITIRECRGIDTDFYKVKKELQYKFPQVYFLSDGDYNFYYMPDNKVYKSYEAEEEASEFRR